MSVNGVTNIPKRETYQNTSSTAKTKEPTNEINGKAEVPGAVYEPSKPPKAPAKPTYKPNTELVAKLQADAEAQTANLMNIVKKMMTQQGNSYGQANGVWRFLADGNFTVDAATKSQAQADIAENGYWGVKNTSDRIFDFAKALSGGDPDKMEEMRSAFEKGYRQATGDWGKELPSISKQTHDAVMNKFDQFAETSKNNSANMESSI